MFVPRTLRNFGDLVMLFTEKKLPVRVDSEQQILDVAGVRLHWADPFLHVIRPLLTTVAADRDVEHAIVERNHAARLPLLDFDAKTRTVSLRVTLVILVDGVRLDLLEAMLGGMEARATALRAELAHLG